MPIEPRQRRIDDVAGDTHVRRVPRIYNPPIREGCSQRNTRRRRILARKVRDVRRPFRCQADKSIRVEAENASHVSRSVIAQAKYSLSNG